MRFVALQAARRFAKLLLSAGIVLHGFVLVGYIRPVLAHESDPGNHGRVSPVGLLASDTGSNLLVRFDGVVYEARHAEVVAGIGKRQVQYAGGFGNTDYLVVRISPGHR